MPDVDLPDFDDMLRIGQQIKEKIIERDDLDIKIKSRESEIYRITATNSQYLTKDGKPPSASFVKATYEYPGLEGELLPLRKQYSVLIAEIENLRLVFDVMRMKVDLYRTESANKRFATL